MESKTHLGISGKLVGEPVELGEGTALAKLTTVDEMCADERGLVHGGFTFGLADYAAMLAVNDPHVVLGGADVRFLAPVRCGAVLLASARLETRDGKKCRVVCRVEDAGKVVFEGTFTCFVLDRHILD